MNLLPSWLRWSLCALPVTAATFVSCYLSLRELAVGLLGGAVLLREGRPSAWGTDNRGLT